MKNFKLFFPLLLVIFLTNAIFAQTRFFGTVTEVIDGKTLVIQPQAKVNIKVELQFIEIPEAEQQFYGVVKDHLTNMVLNKVVEFRPKNLNDESRPIAQVLLNGVDVSQQMLRDGAAWYAVNEKKLQEETERAAYQSNEESAKNEKRGIWSIPNLKPAWELRAERAEVQRQIELKKQAEEKESLAKIIEEQKAAAIAKVEERRKARENAKQNYGIDSRLGLGLGIEEWQDDSSSGMQKKTGYPNLLTKNIPDYGIEYILTGGNFYSFKSGKDQLKIESRSLYLKQENAPPQLRDIFGIGFLAKSEKATFAKSNDLIIYADKKAINLGKAYYFVKDKSDSVEELLLYKISKVQLETISKATDVSVKIGEFTGSLNIKYKEMMNELIQAAD